MAHCIAVPDNVVRVQLPAGPVYAATLREAAEKTTSRASLPDDRVDAIGETVAAAIDAMNASGAESISLEITIHDGSTHLRMLGKFADAPAEPDDAAFDDLDSVAARNGIDAATTVNKASLRVDLEADSPG